MSTELLARIDKNRVYCLTYDYDFRGTEYLPFTIKPRHASEGRSIAAVLADRIDYGKNQEKINGGLLVTGYQCSPDTAWQEFMVSK